MKKLLLLLLVFTGMVSTASATKRIWLNLTETNSDWTKDNSVTCIHYAGMDWNTHTPMTTIYMYGKKWCYYDVDDNISLVVLKRCGGSPLTYWDWQSADISWSGTADLYVKLTGADSKIAATTLSAPTWNNVVFRQNIIDWQGNNGITWSDVDMHNTSHPDGDTFIFELSKAQINASSNKDQGIRFRLYNKDYVNFDDAGNAVNGNPQIYPTATTLDDGEGHTYGAQLNIANNTSTYYQNTTTTNWYWQINIPSYDYEKIVITAKYVNESGYKWKVSADAYISKTLLVSEGETYYGTFGSEADVDFTNVTDLTAQKITAASLATGVLSPATATTLKAGEGALLSAETAGPFSIPVAASADADASNLLVAGTGDDVAEEEGIYTNFILTNKKDVNGTSTPAELKFYRINVSKAIPAGSAYLRVQTGTTAPDFLWFNDMTGIEKVSVDTKALNGAYYNLNGQRVAQPTKGLYIVNGKKVVLK